METMRFQYSIVESSKVSPLLTRVKIRVAYDGENRNGSFISKDTFEKAAYSAKFCPIVGEWYEEKQEFGDHGGKLEISDEGEVTFKRTTVPYGVIDNQEPTWESIIDDNGKVKEYFTLYGYIWDSRYPELKNIINDGFRFHSMEIEIGSGNFQNIDGKKLYVIDDMIFSAFCILGDVEPCFEDSTISTYSLDAQKFKVEYSQMLAELRHFTQEFQHGLEGGKKMEETKEELVLEERQFDAAEPEDEDGEVEIEIEVEDDDDSQDEDQEDVAEDNQEEMAKKPDSEPDGDEDGKDTDDDGDGKFELIQSELASLKEKYSLLEEEIVGLREFKAQKLHEEKAEHVNALFESVAGELTEEELAPFKEKAFEMEIEALKKELFALIGQKEFEKKSKFSANTNKPMTMGIELNGETKIEASYASIIKKYNNK